MYSDIGILGYGEVGTSISELYKNEVQAQDPGCNLEFMRSFDILHVCIPYTDIFVKEVGAVLHKWKPKLVVINSTVKVGTTAVISDIYPNLIDVAHHPIRGVHPHIADTMKKFVNYLGCEHTNAGKRIKEHYRQLGISTKIIIPSKTTELAKLLDTAYYGLCISYHQYALELCEKEGVSFEVVMTNFNNSYNAGYSACGMPWVRRPVLYPPGSNIGGHCIVKNAKLLQEQYGFEDILKRIK